MNEQLIRTALDLVFGAISDLDKGNTEQAQVKAMLANALASLQTPAPVIIDRSRNLATQVNMGSTEIIDAWVGELEEYARQINEPELVVPELEPVLSGRQRAEAHRARIQGL